MLSALLLYYFPFLALIVLAEGILTNYFNKVSTGTFLHNALVFFRVFVKEHSNITGYHPQ